MKWLAKMKKIIISAAVVLVLLHTLAEASVVSIDGSFSARAFTALLPITNPAAIAPQYQVTGSFKLSFDPETMKNQYGNEFQILDLVDLDFLSLEINQLSYFAQDGQAWLFWDIVNNKLLNITLAGIANSAGGPNLLTSRGTNDFIFVSSRNEFIYTTADTTENWAASNVTANVNATAVPEPSSLLMLATSIPLAFFAVRRRRPSSISDNS
jgi:hypothetical protein